MQKTILDTSIITLQNIASLGTQTMVQFTDGSSFRMSDPVIKFVIIGNAHSGNSQYGNWTVDIPSPDPSLTHTGVGIPGVNSREPYFTKSRPQYEGISTGAIINVKSLGAKGDGVTDDTQVIIRALYVPCSSFYLSLLSSRTPLCLSTSNTVSHSQRRAQSDIHF